MTGLKSALGSVFYLACLCGTVILLALRHWVPALGLLLVGFVVVNALDR